MKHKGESIMDCSSLLSN